MADVPIDPIGAARRLDNILGRADLPYTYTDRDGDVLIVDARTIKAVNLHDTGAHEATVGAPTSSDAVAMARAVLAAAGDTGHRVVSQAEVEALQHRPEDRCYFCATDAEMTAAMESRPHPTIHMNLPEGACPQVRTTDALDTQLPDRNGDVVNDIRIALDTRVDLTPEHRAFYSEIIHRFEGLAADRDQVRVTRDRYRDERNDLRREVRAESERDRLRARVAELEDRQRYSDTHVANAARSMRERAAEWLVDNDFAWEAEQIRNLPLIPDSEDTLPEADMVESGDEVPDLAELHELVERLAIDLSETTKVVTQRLATVEDRLGITDEETTEAPARYRDADGDLWEETSPGYLLLAVRRLPHVRMSRPYDVVDGEFGPLTPVTYALRGSETWSQAAPADGILPSVRELRRMHEEEKASTAEPAPCEVCGRAPDEQEHGPNGQCRHTPATRLGHPTT